MVGVYSKMDPTAGIYIANNVCRVTRHGYLDNGLRGE